MTDITEDGRYFSGYDHKVHDSDGHDFYVDDGLWDTYRSLHPLQLLLEAPQQENMIRSYLRMYEQSGWLPSFPSVAGEQSVMIGHHAAAYILDAYMKGYRNFDVEEAYQAIRKNETQATILPWKLGGGQGGRDYFTEVNSWLYTFHVQHDVAGLVQMMGGRDDFNARLDQLFVEQYGTSKYSYLDQFPDSTGLVGLYSQGNEPSFHIPYLYDFSGQPWKTQQRVRMLMDVWYGDGPTGIPGDDDGGETSSWLVLSAMGFYPVCPGSPVYEIGSPIFEKSSIRMANGKEFTIIANHVSARNKYIQSAQLNVKNLERPWFADRAIANEGSVLLEMGDK